MKAVGKNEVVPRLQSRREYHNEPQLFATRAVCAVQRLANVNPVMLADKFLKGEELMRNTGRDQSFDPGSSIRILIQ